MNAPDTAALFSLHEKIGDAQLDLKDMERLLQNALSRFSTLSAPEALRFQEALTDLRTRIFSLILLGHELSADLIRGNLL